jgi:hypothetical protein
MKHISFITFFSIILIFWLIPSEKAFSQIIKGEVMAGLNMTQVDGDEVFGFKKPGLNLGAGAMIPIGKGFDLSLETNFSQKGSKQIAQYISDSLNGAYQLYLNYVEIPLLVHYTDKDLVSVGTGFSWGRLVGAKEFEHDRQTTTTAQNGIYSPNDFCVLVDLRLKVYQALKFNFRYSYSMSRIRTREFSDAAGNTWSRGQFNNVLTFRMLYMFNEERSKRNFEQR